MLRSLKSIFNPGPVSARLEFEDRSYGLGGSMKLSVELNARRELGVEEARVDLECEERWADTYVKMEPLGRTGGMLGRGKPMPGPAAPKPMPTRAQQRHIRPRSIHLASGTSRPTRTRSSLQSAASPQSASRSPERGDFRRRTCNNPVVPAKSLPRTRYRAGIQAP